MRSAHRGGKMGSGTLGWPGVMVSENGMSQRLGANLGQGPSLAPPGQFQRPAQYGDSPEMQGKIGDHIGPANAGAREDIPQRRGQGGGQITWGLCGHPCGEIAKISLGWGEGHVVEVDQPDGSSAITQGLAGVEIAMDDRGGGPVPRLVLRL